MDYGFLNGLADAQLRALGVLPQRPQPEVVSDRYRQAFPNVHSHDRHKPLGDRRPTAAVRLYGGVTPDGSASYMKASYPLTDREDLDRSYARYGDVPPRGRPLTDADRDRAVTQGRYFVLDDESAMYRRAPVAPEDTAKAPSRSVAPDAVVIGSADFWADTHARLDAMFARFH